MLKAPCAGDILRANSFSDAVLLLRCLQDYERRKAEDPDFNSAADSLMYGKTVKDSDQAIDRMVAELNKQCALSGCQAACLTG